VTIAGEVLKIGGSLGAGNVGQGGLIPIVKGSVYNVTAGVNPYTIKFYPVKGAN
jgi:malic enzyme